MSQRSALAKLSSGAVSKQRQQSFPAPSRSMAGMHGAEAQKLPLSWIEQCADLGESCLPTFAAGTVIFGRVPTTSATVLPWSSFTGVAKKEWTIVPACGPAISTAIPAICPLSLMLLAEIT